MSDPTPDISVDEARRALASIREVEAQTRRAIGQGGGGQIVMVWGVVWLIGYLASHFLAGPIVGVVWGVVDLLGLAATLWIVSRVTKRLRNPLGPRIGLYWLALLVFTGLWIWLSQPLTYNQIGLLIALAMMFGYVTLGLFLDLAFLWVGLGVSALAVAGYLAVPESFYLWMALLGGGTLIGSGLYVSRRWS